MRAVFFGIFLLGVGLFAGGQTKKEGGTELRFLTMAQAAYPESDVNGMVADFIKANPGINVVVEFVPYEELRTKTLLAFGSPNPYDVVAVDDIWFSEYIQKGIIAEITQDVPADFLSGIHPGGWNISRRNGKIYGVPWILDTMFLFSNRKMMSEVGVDQAPKTLTEVFSVARMMKDQGVSTYPLVLSLSQAEALICVYGTFLFAYGGSFQNEQGEYLLNSPQAVAALTALVKLKQDGVLNPNSLEYLEEDVRRVFSNGDAAFTLNWTYMYALANDEQESKVVGQVDMAPLPGLDGKPVALSGSMGLGVVSKSNNREAAIKLALYLGSRDVQERYSQHQLPTWKASFDEPKVREGREKVVDAARQAFSLLAIRPDAGNYNAVSLALQKHIQSALLEQATPAEALNAAMDEIGKLKK